jgi:hypothetical protein
MKRIALLICILFLTASCEIEYDGETKLVITGKLIDQDKKSLANKDVEIRVLAHYGFSKPISELISFGKSDNNGNFTLIFPAPRDENDLLILINESINQKVEFQTKRINALKLNFDNYKLDLHKITLFKNESITKLRLVVNNISKNKTVKDFKIEGKLATINVDLNSNDLAQDDPHRNFNEIANQTVVKNQTVILKYKVVDNSNNGATTLESVSIPINNDPVIYTITY